jgi:hypothetical protein
VWERETFAVAENKNEAKFEESPGYFAPPDVERSIIDFFRKVLQVEPEQAKVLPLRRTLDRWQAAIQTPPS